MWPECMVPQVFFTFVTMMVILSLRKWDRRLNDTLYVDSFNDCLDEADKIKMPDSITDGKKFGQRMHMDASGQTMVVLAEGSSDKKKVFVYDTSPPVTAPPTLPLDEYVKYAGT